jgi:hypothetical protein
MAVLLVKKLGRVVPVIPEYGRVYFKRRKMVALLKTFQ